MLLPDSHWYNTTPACDRQTQGDSKYRASIALREKIPRFRSNTYGRRAFSFAVPMAWNTLWDFIPDPLNCRVFQAFPENVLARVILVHPAH